jgi:hypothetical protein
LRDKLGIVVCGHSFDREHPSPCQSLEVESDELKKSAEFWPDQGEKLDRVWGYVNALDSTDCKLNEGRGENALKGCVTIREPAWSCGCQPEYFLCVRRVTHECAHHSAATWYRKGLC